MRLTETTTATIKSINYTTKRPLRYLFRPQPVTRIDVETESGDYHETYKDGHSTQLQIGQSVVVEVDYGDRTLLTLLEKLLGKDPAKMTIYHHGGDSLLTCL